jgi:glutamyl/glutaminyl-tRNA synthetase
MHHPLVRHPGGAKLSKSAGDSGVRELRAAGVTPAEVLGRAAQAAGLLEQVRPLALDEIVEFFAQQ